MSSRGHILHNILGFASSVPNRDLLTNARDLCGNPFTDDSSLRWHIKVCFYVVKTCVLKRLKGVIIMSHV